jgi:hypothetical protein
MTLRFSTLLACLFGALIGAGCGNSDSGTEGSTQTGGASGASGTGGTSGVSGMGGTSGTSGAGTGGLMCRALETDPRQTLDACGGDPMGMWRLTSMDATGMFMTLEVATGPDTVETTECETELAGQTETFDFLMNFAADGVLETYVGVFQVSLLTDNACFQDGAGVSCDDVSVAGQCRSDTCGICKCDLGNQTAGAGGGMWSSMDGTLFVNGSTGYDYCVVGDTLTLLNRSGVRFTFARFQNTAAPVPCTERTSDTCLRGSGCARTGDTCFGTAPASCAFSDYHVTPGCEPPLPEGLR